ncbi:MAG: cohesin domain-containing protein [Caldicoprobacterales bacterium]|jgi:hypothetical protein
MNRHNTRLSIILLLVLLIAVQIQSFALAAPRTELKITADSADILPGNTFGVIITFTSRDEDISVIQASIEYDADILEYKFGGNAVELSAGTGGISDNISPGSRKVSYEIRFTAVKPGKAKIAVNHSQLIGHDTGSILGEPVASTMISISEPTGQPGDDIHEEPSETLPGDDEHLLDDSWLETILDGETVYIAKDLSDVTLPQGYELDHAMYEGEEIQVARDPVRNLDLIYLRARGFSSFYIYDQHDSIYPYISMDINEHYFILQTRDAPSNSVETTLMLNDKSVQAWVSDKYGEDFYIVYAVNSIGNKGYYLYDTREGTMQRLITEYNNVNKIDEEN